MNNNELEAFIEKFLFLNFNNNYDMEECLLSYFQDNSIDNVKEDTYKLRLYLKHKQISKKRKNILIICCVPSYFLAGQLSATKWAEDWLLYNLDKYIEENDKTQ